MDGCNFEKCKWLDLLFFKKYKGEPRNSDANAATPCTFFCLRTEPNRNKWDLQGQFKENELPQRIFAQVQSESTFRTFVNWYTHTPIRYTRNEKTFDLHVNCVIDGSRVRDRKHESCEQLARHNIGITQNPWTPNKKKTVANSIFPILHPSRCVLAFKPTAPQAISSMCAHLRVLLNWLHVFVARSIMVKHSRRRRQNAKVQMLILEPVTRI